MSACVNVYVAVHVTVWAEFLASDGMTFFVVSDVRLGHTMLVASFAILSSTTVMFVRSKSPVFFTA